MKLEGPFREAGDPNVRIIKNLEAKIAKEAGGKFSIRLPENIKKGDEVPLFLDAIKNKIEPKNIMLYSANIGIFKFFTTSDMVKGTKIYFYEREDPSFPEKSLTIWVTKDKATVSLLP